MGIRLLAEPKDEDGELVVLLEEVKDEPLAKLHDFIAALKIHFLLKVVERRHLKPDIWFEKLLLLLAILELGLD